MTTLGDITINWPYLIGAILGAVIGARLFSWLFVWVVQKVWRSGDGVTKLIVGYGIAVVLSELVSAFGFADGGPLNWTAGLRYMVPFAVFFVIDLRRIRRAQRQGPAV